MRSNLHRLNRPTLLRRLKQFTLLSSLLCVLGTAAFFSGNTVYRTGGTWVKRSNRLLEAGYTNSSPLGDWLRSQEPWVLLWFGLSLLAVVALSGYYLQQAIVGRRDLGRWLKALVVILVSCFTLAVWSGDEQQMQQTAGLNRVVASMPLQVVPGDTDLESLRWLEVQAKRSFRQASPSDTAIAAAWRWLPDAIALGANLALQLGIMLAGLVWLAQEHFGWRAKRLAQVFLQVMLMTLAIRLVTAALAPLVLWGTFSLQNRLQQLHPSAGLTWLMTALLILVVLFSGTVLLVRYHRRAVTKARFETPPIVEAAT